MKAGRDKTKGSETAHRPGSASRRLLGSGSGRNQPECLDRRVPEGQSPRASKPRRLRNALKSRGSSNRSSSQTCRCGERWISNVSCTASVALPSGRADRSHVGLGRHGRRRGLPGDRLPAERRQIRIRRRYFTSYFFFMSATDLRMSFRNTFVSISSSLLK